MNPTMVFPPNVRVLCVDPGTKRWGVAVGDSATGRAMPLHTVTGEFDVAIAKIVKLAKSERADYLLLGRPVHMNDAESGMTKLSDRALDALKAAGLNVIPYDERLTSFSAEEYLKGSGQKFSHNKALVDRVSAALMLESAFREQLFAEPTS
jgi:putative holliday junction resolvase